MEIRVLGRLEVSDGGRPIEVRRPRERALLTMLASEADQIVSTDRLIDGLWGESPPATSAKTLQTYIHHLRSLLPSEAIVTEGDGYRLLVNRADVDAHRFQSEVESVRAEPTDDSVSRAALLDRALSWWRGRPFSDAEETEWLRPLRTRLEDLHLQATADLLGARIRDGHHDEVLPELRSLLELHPLREDLWGNYMLALYRSGRQAEALRAFTDARRHLVEELGIEPGPHLRTLEERILLQDPSLVPEPITAQETPVRTDRPPETPLHSEQRWATIVMAELTGIESLREVVGDDTCGRIRKEAINAMGATMERLGATVVRREDCDVLASFGAPIAREDDTYRAISAALAMREEMAETGRDIERAWAVGEVDVKAAVSTLSVTVPFEGDAGLFDSLGPLQQLLTSTGPGSVLVDEHTRSLMGDLFAWEEADAAGRWRARQVRAGPDKARMGRRLHAPLIGRERELEVAEEALASLEKGLGGVLLISGEAGVGKTRLVSEMQRTGPAAEPTWLVGHCVSYAEATPYWPFRDLLRSWLDLGLNDTDLETRIALHNRLDKGIPEQANELYPYLGGLLGIALEPDQAGRLQLASEALRYRTFEVVSTAIDALAEQAPLVMVIEDVHWADPTSIQLIDQILPLTEKRALLVVLTTRPDPDHLSQKLAATARQHHPHRTTELVLESLNSNAQRALLDALVGSVPLPAPTMNHILRLAEGNPFYLEELVGALIDEGALVSSPSGWELHHEAELTVPETVEKVVQARIDRLDQQAQELLTASSVLGRSFGLPLLLGVVGDSEGTIDSIHDLLRMDLLVEARRWPQAEYLFKHALIQEAAYRILPEQRRAELHRLAAEWLERRYVHNEDEVIDGLARHWTAAGVEDKAVASLVRAGDLARRDHALDEAIGHYRELLPIMERREERQAMALVLFKLGLALHESLRFGESNATYQRAFELWEPGPSPEATAILRFSGPPFYQIPDPVRSYMLNDMQLQMALFDRLVERWPDDTLVPSLAERWEIADDGLRYTFYLREGLNWSDGQPLTADDVEFGIKRNLDPDRPGMAVAMFYVLEEAQDYVFGRTSDLDRVGVTALDDRTVEFRLVAPAPYLLGMLNRPDAGPHPRHAIERLGEAWGTSDNEVVSGAFSRRSHTADLVILERRPGYTGARTGNVEVVEWQPAPVEDSLAAYQRGDNDLVWIGAPWVVPGIDQIPGNEVWFEPRAGLIYLIFFQHRPMATSLSFRLALAHGIDRGKLDPLLPRNSGASTGGVVPPALAGHTPDIAPRFDPDLGKALLAEVDVSGPVRVAVQKDRIFAQVTRAAADMWREHLGLEVEVVGLDPHDFSLVDQDTSEFDVATSWWYPGYTDPEYFLRLLLHSEGADNFGKWSYPPYDDLIERARQERDERTRLALYHQADRMAVAEQAAMIPLAYCQNVSLRRPGVHGWWEFGKSWANFADLTVEA